MVSRAVTLAEERGLTPFCALQVPYSLVERTVERELLPVARALDLAVTGWAPLGGGLLTGRYGSDRERPDDGRLARRTLSERKLAIADALNSVAEARGASASQVAIAWVRAQQRRAVTIPIVGVRTEAQLADNLAATKIDLVPPLAVEISATSVYGSKVALTAHRRVFKPSRSSACRFRQVHGITENPSFPTVCCLLPPDTLAA